MGIACCCAEDDRSHIVDKGEPGNAFSQALDETPNEVVQAIEAAQAAEAKAEVAEITQANADTTRDELVVAETVHAAKKEIETAMPIGDGVWIFNITLKKNDPNAHWNLELRRHGQQVVIGSQFSSALEEWHRINPTKRVVAGDELISVNGISGDIDTLVEAMSNNELEIALRRHLQVCVHIMKNGPIGLGLADDFAVTEILEGPIQDYNDHSEPSQEIYMGDILAAINDMTASSHDLRDELDKFEDGDEIQLIFQRPA